MTSSALVALDVALNNRVAEGRLLASSEKSIHERQAFAPAPRSPLR
ncbi:hypothetical protein ACLQ25_32565 [Micromonospora sp. DT44]